MDGVHALTTASPFKVRGVIEGFHGRPWTQDQRLEMVDFLAERGDGFSDGERLLKKDTWSAVVS